MVAPRVVFLVPRRDDNGWRDRLWAVARARWEALFPDWPIVEGYHTEGPWNRSAAINEAARLAGDWDIALAIDGDVMLEPEQVRQAVETAQRTGRVTWAHRGWRELTEQTTRELVADPSRLAEPDLLWLVDRIRKETPISWSCCMAIPRTAWDALGGFDERFQGWGGEDTAFAAAVQGLIGHERIEGFVWNLWHPRSPGDGRPGSSPEYVTNMRLRDRYAMALRRDHRLHDRVSPADEAERLRDIDNIRRGDDRHAEKAKAMNLPDWDDWWPSLDDLVARRMPTPKVALVVHTGGAPETWPERSAYLRASLASLRERVHLERWERQVIFSDWGDQFRDELDAIALEFGLYVKGPEQRLGYTPSMQALWRYIARYVRAEYVFAVEDDFRYERDVEVASMVETLASRPHLVQLALLRAPISEREHMAETVLGHPCAEFDRRATHLEHRRFFTVNPMLMRTSLAVNHPWPSGPHSEAVYGRSLFHDPKAKAGLWGDGAAYLTHIGETRAGGPY